MLRFCLLISWVMKKITLRDAGYFFSMPSCQFLTDGQADSSSLAMSAELIRFTMASVMMNDCFLYQCGRSIFFKHKFYFLHQSPQHVFVTYLLMPGISEF